MGESDDQNGERESIEVLMLLGRPKLTPRAVVWIGIFGDSGDEHAGLLVLE